MMDSIYESRIQEFDVKALSIKAFNCSNEKIAYKVYYHLEEKS